MGVSASSAAAAIPTALSALGTGISAGGVLSAGSTAAALGKAQQSYLNVEAGQAVAQGTQEASDTALQTKYIISNVRGAAGASGAVATSPDVVNVEGQIAARGSYNALSEMYQQNEKAIGLTYQGQIAAATGEVTQQADVTKALSTVLTGAGSLATKYGSPTGNNSISPASIATYGYGYM